MAVILSSGDELRNIYLPAIYPDASFLVRDITFIIIIVFTTS